MMDNEFWLLVQKEFIELTNKLSAEHCSSEEDPDLIEEIHQMEDIIRGFRF